jgi:hypothetical protein
MSNWIAWTSQKPAAMQVVLTHHDGHVGADWVDNEMLRDAESGVKPVTDWMAVPPPPTMVQLELDFGE